MKWVTLTKYCEASGETPMAVYKRKGQGIWLEGVHVKKAGDGKLWVNLEAVQQWVETSSPDQKTGSAAHA